MKIRNALMLPRTVLSLFTKDQRNSIVSIDDINLAIQSIDEIIYLSKEFNKTERI